MTLLPFRRHFYISPDCFIFVSFTLVQKFKTKKSKRRDSSIVAHGEFNVLISAGIEPATFSVLTKCDNPYTTKPRDEIGADILLLDSVVDGNLSFRFNKKKSN
jgi:hypothetical protein